MFRKRSKSNPPEVVAYDATPVAEVQSRVHTTVMGQITSIKTQPSRGLPNLVMKVTDESGSATVTWSGRRSIGGITLGRKILITGVAMRTDGIVAFVNPEYQLLA